MSKERNKKLEYENTEFYKIHPELNARKRNTEQLIEWHVPILNKKMSKERKNWSMILDFMESKGFSTRFVLD